MAGLNVGVQPSHNGVAGCLDTMSGFKYALDENRAPHAAARSASPIKLVRRNRARDVAASARTTPVSKQVHATTGLGSPLPRGEQVAAWPRLTLWGAGEDSHESTTPKSLGSNDGKAMNSSGQRMADLFLSSRRKHIEGCDEVEAFV